MQQRSPYPPVFWVANLIEILERFAYYGIYFSFGIYMTSLGYSRADLGIIQTLFLLLSYTVPLFSGTLADRYGFKKLLIVSCTGAFCRKISVDAHQTITARSSPCVFLNRSMSSISARALSRVSWCSASGSLSAVTAPPTPRVARPPLQTRLRMTMLRSIVPA